MVNTKHEYIMDLTHTLVLYYNYFMYINLYNYSNMGFMNYYFAMIDFPLLVFIQNKQHENIKDLEHKN